MDETPRPLDRWLPYLGVALLAEGILGILLPALARNSYPAVLIATLLLVMLAGLACIVAGRATAAFRYPRLLLVLILMAVGGTELFGLIGTFTKAYGLRSYWFFQAVSYLLIGLGAPILWASALARREDPGSCGAEKAGRMSAGVVQLGFVFLFVAELWTFSAYSYMSTRPPAEVALFTVGRVVQVAERILLLWSSVDAVRRAPDEAVVRMRAGRMHRFLTWWLVLQVLGAGLGQVQSVLQGRMMMEYVWRGAVVLTATFAAALAVARHLRAVYGSYKSDSPSHPWSGAEA